MSKTKFLGSATAVDMNTLLTHTTQKINEKGIVFDAVTSSNPLFAELKKGGGLRKSTDGGTHLQVNLMHTHGNTFKMYHRFDVLPNDPQDPATCAYYPWKQGAYTVSIDGLTTLQNAGTSRIKEVISTLFQQASATIAEQTENQLWDATQVTATTGGGDKNLYSIPMLIDFDSDRNRAIAGINGSTSAWWRNQTLDYGGTHSATWLKAKLLNMYNTCADKSMGQEPKLIFMDQASYENYELSIEGQRRYADGGSQTAGFEGLYYKKAKVLWSSKITNAEADGANSTDGTIYFINPQYFCLYVLGGRNWQFDTKWEKPLQQDAKQTTGFFAGALAVTNRRPHGVIYGVDKTSLSA